MSIDTSINVRACVQARWVLVASAYNHDCKVSPQRRILMVHAMFIAHACYSTTCEGRHCQSQLASTVELSKTTDGRVEVAAEVVTFGEMTAMAALAVEIGATGEIAREEDGTRAVVPSDRAAKPTAAFGPARKTA